MLVCAHLAVIAELSRFVRLGAAAGIVAGADLVIAGIAGLLAVRNKPGAEERTALALRQEAVGAVRREFAWAALLPTLIAIVRRYL
jgi:hypothetical protein